MKIGLINAYSTRNAGDAAIYAALEKILAGHELLALADARQHPQLAGIAIAPLDSECDAYLSVGGDIFNNARPRLITCTFLRNLRQLQRYPRRTVLFGQSIPASCRGWAFRLLCRALKNLSGVVVRDTESWQRLRQAGVDAQLSYDTAFVHRPGPVELGEALALLADRGLDATRSVLLSLREFDALYPHDNARVAAKLACLCWLLYRAGLQPALLVQSAAEGGDVAMALAIVRQVPGLPIINVLQSPPHLASYELLQALSALASLTVGMRYHTTVLAMAAGRLPYNLYYSNKGRDLSERLGIPGCEVAAFEPEQRLAELLDLRGRAFEPRRLRQQVEASLLRAMDTVLPAVQPRLMSWPG